MLKIDTLGKRMGLFVLVYIGLIVIFLWQPLQTAHLHIYSAVADKIFNVINPNLYTDFKVGAPPNEENWNSTIELYYKDKHGDRLGNKAYMRSINPDRLMWRNLYELVLLPTLFLVSLFIVTPLITWKRKILYFIACLAILYIFLSFHYSHIFENLVINEGVVGPTSWHKFIATFGFQGLNEPLYIVCILSWGAFCFRPEMIKFLK